MKTYNPHNEQGIGGACLLQGAGTSGFPEMADQLVSLAELVSARFSERRSQKIRG